MYKPSISSFAQPQLGYGTGTAWYKTEATWSLNESLVESIKTAIKLGYHHLDGAESGHARYLGILLQAYVQ